MMRVVVCGQVRDVQSATQVLDTMLRLTPANSIILSIWSDESEQQFVDESRAKGVVVRESAPLRNDYWGNPRRQSQLLRVALDGASPSEPVLKVRPDWRLTAESAQELLDATSDLPAVVSATATEPSVVISWFNPQVPFRISDEAFGASAFNMSRLCPTRNDTLAACPHVGRFAALGPLSAPLAAFMDGPYRAMVLSKVRGAPSAAAAEGTALPSRVRLFRPPMYEFLRSLAVLDLQRQALGDWLHWVGSVARVVNNRPEVDQYISRMDGPWSQGRYVDVRRSVTPLDPSQFSIAYDSSRETLDAIARTDQAVWDRLSALREQPELYFSPLAPGTMAEYGRQWRRLYARMTTTGLVSQAWLAAKGGRK